MILLNLNAQSHFSVNPINLDIGRSRFERPKRHLFTGNVGDLIPTYWTEILPGDTVSMKSSEVVRMSTLLDPVFDNLWMDINWFFVPMRLVWNHTKEFFGENTGGAWAPATTYTVPQLLFNTANTSQSIADYMGVPVGVTGLSVSALPVRAYVRVYDDWFRDENLVTPPVLTTGDAATNWLATYSDRGGVPFKVAKFHDYLTSCLPAPQRGNAVLIPYQATGNVFFNGTAPVVSDSSMHNMVSSVKLGNDQDNVSGYPAFAGFINNSAQFDMITSTNNASYHTVTESNLVADINGVTGALSGSSNLSVNDLRLAFQMQKWLEKSAMFGGRYVSMLKAQFGVTSPDARLQRSEYLGGRRVPIHVSEVVNTNGATGTGSKPLGELGAYSHTADADDDFTHSFTEHGFLLCTVCFRYKHSYSQSINREWSRKTMWDYYFPVMANIGNQPVLRKEIYADGTNADDNVFGYQEAWAEYRYSQDQISGLFKPGITGSLSSWHYGDYYTTAPTLSAGWIVEDKSMVDRTLAVSSSATVPQLLCDFYFNPVFVRPMPLYSIPGLIDHH